MSRSDGNFPSYVKLDVDPDNPKKGWDKGCRRCSVCAKSWPNVAVFSPSPCHHATAGIVATGKPDMPWKDAIHDLLIAKFDRYYERWNENTTDEELYWSSARQPVDENEVRQGVEAMEDFLTHHALTDKT